MARLWRRWCTALVGATVLVAGCTSQAGVITQHQEKFESLGATTAAIAEAWLGGSASGTFTRTALEQTYQLVEQQRTALASKPAALSDSRGAHLSEAAERLSRLLASMIDDVEHGNAGALREHVAQIPIRPSHQP